jgi:CheY-like chemotaxis protein
LILLDLKMPVMTGFDVLAWLQIRPEFRHIPVVVLTSSDHGPDRRKALEMGAAEYLVKPNGVDELVVMVKGLQERWLASATPT